MPRSFEREFEIGRDGWTSPVRPVQHLLDHLARRMKSCRQGDRYLEIMQSFVRFAHMRPEQLVKMTTEAASELVQDYMDNLTCNPSLGVGRAITNGLRFA